MQFGPGDGLPGPAWQQGHPIILRQFEGPCVKRTAEAFATIARHVSLRRCTGLPGIVWDTGMPLFVDDLGRSQRFLRAASATKVGINRGPAMPCAKPGQGTWALAFLSALGTPLALRIEVWLPDPGHTTLRRVAGHCEVLGKLPPGEGEPPVARGAGTLGRAMASGIPGISHQAGAEPGELGASAQAAGLTVLLAMPLLRDGRLLAVIGWYF